MSLSDHKWQLPDGVEELLPEKAWRLECLRRRIIETFLLNGYQLVQPPLLEFIDSLLTGAGRDLDLLTFKVTDHHSGRLMGVRADMTPQLSRIDAHVLNQPGPSRLCYAGPVLQTEARSGFHNREPMQFGAELFGHAGIRADVEIIRLCADVFKSLGIDGLNFDLGHVGIFRALVAQAGLNDEQTDQLLDISRRKSWPDMREFIEHNKFENVSGNIFMDLLALEGPENEVLNKAEALFKNTSSAVQKQFAEFKDLIRLLSDYLPELNLSVDFLELRGINYHTGAVFSVYLEGSANALAKGGRYDDVGEAFGRARPATGFSADLRQCLEFSNAEQYDRDNLIHAPFDPDPGLRRLIDELRQKGEKVVVGLESESADDYKRQIVNDDNGWKLTDSKGWKHGE